MKHTLITAIALIVSGVAQAQTKPLEAPKKEYTVTMPIEAYRVLVEQANAYKACIPYLPQPKPEQKVNAQINIDATLAQIEKLVRIDSVEVKGGKKP